MKFKIGDTILHKCSISTKIKIIAFYENNYIGVYEGYNSLTTCSISFDIECQYELFKDRDKYDKS